MSASEGAQPSRLQSIDLLRGLDVWLMLFVNEMAGVKGTPAFLLHFPRDGDGMTITDVVFPAFLFIVGLSVPFALGGRLRRGASAFRVWGHVLVRTLGLLAMGVLTVNAGEASAFGPVPPHVWNVLMTIGVLLVWQARGADPERAGPARLGRLVGVALLLVLIVLFRRQGVSGLVQIRPLWWGILGLIGWAYLVSATLYLVVRDRPAPLVGAVALLCGVYLADEAGSLSLLMAARPMVNLGRTVASHSAITIAGVVLAVLLRRSRAAARSGDEDIHSGSWIALGALGYAGALALAAWLLHALHALHPAFTISKVKATPPWCLYSSAWTAAAWALVYWLVDVKGWNRWPRAILVAGENALLAYLLPSLLLSLFALSAPLFGGVDPYARLGGSLAIGLVRSLAFSGIVVWLCGLMRSHGIRMQL